MLSLWRSPAGRTTRAALAGQAGLLQLELLIEADLLLLNLVLEAQLLLLVSQKRLFVTTLLLLLPLLLLLLLMLLLLLTMAMLLLLLLKTFPGISRRLVDVVIHLDFFLLFVVFVVRVDDVAEIRRSLKRWKRILTQTQLLVGQSTEAAFTLLTQQPRVRFSGFPKIFLRKINSMSPRLIDSSLLREWTVRSLTVDRIHLVLTSGKVVLQKNQFTFPEKQST